jgi:hypothetical protein
MRNQLHIVCLDVPFPADYGGAIDMFYRIQALHELGLELTLHVFHYGREKQSELEKYGKVIYYERKRTFWHLFSKRPFIVQSRISAELLSNLRKDDSPILFEGIHTIWSLEMPDIQERMTLVRMHNLEDEYYQGLRKQANWFQKIYFEQERVKLKRYAKQLKVATHILAIKPSDAQTLKSINASVHVLPASIPSLNNSFTSVEPYAFFHGNLSVAENEQAAMWIIQQVKGIISDTFQLRIAGKNPSKRLQQFCIKYNVELVANPSKSVLDELVNRAQIHVLYTEVSSGIKLKLINCLASSGQVLANENMVVGTGLEGLCTIATDAKSFKLHFIGLQNVPLTREAFNERQDILEKHFSTRKNCQLILELINP